MSESGPPVDRERSAGRRLLSGADRWASSPLIALIVIGADMAWILVSIATGFPGLAEPIFQRLGPALTPLAFSGVCSGELCELRDSFPESEREDVAVLTVSVDSVHVHRT